MWPLKKQAFSRRHRKRVVVLGVPLRGQTDLRCLEPYKSFPFPCSPGTLKEDGALLGRGFSPPCL